MGINEQNDNGRRNKKPSSWGIIVVVVALLISAVGDNLENFHLDPRRLALIVAPVIAVAIAVAVIALFLKKRAASEGTKPIITVRRAATRQDQSGFDAANSSYSNDRARRQAQLDNFLKNGTIDKAEYLILMDRYNKQEQQQQR